MLGQTQSGQPAAQDDARDEHEATEAEITSAALSTASVGESDKIGGNQLGLTRWVQLAFVVLALVVFWALDKGITSAWSIWSTPKPVVVTSISAVVAFVVALGAYKSKSLSQLSFEVAGELAKVVWPTRDERWVATIVVIVASIVAAVVVGILDASLKLATDWIFTR